MWDIPHDSLYVHLTGELKVPSKYPSVGEFYQIAASQEDPTFLPRL